MCPEAEHDHRDDETPKIGRNAAEPAGRAIGKNGGEGEAKGGADGAEHGGKGTTYAKTGNGSLALPLDPYCDCATRSRQEDRRSRGVARLVEDSGGARNRRPVEEVLHLDEERPGLGVTPAAADMGPGLAAVGELAGVVDRRRAGGPVGARGEEFSVRGIDQQLGRAQMRGIPRQAVASVYGIAIEDKVGPGRRAGEKDPDGMLAEEPSQGGLDAIVGGGARVHGSAGIPVRIGEAEDLVLPHSMVHSRVPGKRTGRAEE